MLPLLDFCKKKLYNIYVIKNKERKNGLGYDNN